MKGKNDDHENQNSPSPGGRAGGTGRGTGGKPADLREEETDSIDLQEEEPDGEISLRALFEAILFLSNEPLPLSFFVKHLGIEATQARILMDSLVDEYEERKGGIKLCEISNGYQFVTNGRYSGQIRRVMGFAHREGLTKGMLETLAIIAYKQPVVLAEIEVLRGVSSRMMVANLMKRNLIRPMGRKELPGRPLAYGTTDEFLRFFGLNKISDLPKLSEIKEFSIRSGD
jgi:segregation and condensation protein B